MMGNPQKDWDLVLNLQTDLAIGDYLSLALGAQAVECQISLCCPKHIFYVKLKY